MSDSQEREGRGRERRAGVKMVVVGWPVVDGREAWVGRSRPRLAKPSERSSSSPAMGQVPLRREGGVMNRFRQMENAQRWERARCRDREAEKRPSPAAGLTTKAAKTGGRRRMTLLPSRQRTT